MSEKVQKGHPPGLYVLFFTEMWERFSYYGMRAIFSLYMIQALLLDKEFASKIYGNYTGLVYLTPLIGGYVADRYWGNRRSIFWGGITMAVGQFILFFSASFYTDQSFATMLMYVGLGFLIFGNGFFKPNISTMVGQLYKEGDPRVDRAFTIFYMGINLGAFIAPFVAGGLGETGNPADFKWGFLSAGIGMVIGTIIFEMYKNKYVVDADGNAVGMPPSHYKQEIVDQEMNKNKFNPVQVATWTGLFVAAMAIFHYIVLEGEDFIGAFMYSAALIAPLSIITDKKLTKQERDRIFAILLLAFFTIFFWMAFEQAGASLTFFAAEQMDRNLFNFEIPASWFQSVNAIFIVAFAPVFVWLWGALNKRNAEPNTPLKMSIGLVLLALGYFIIAFGVKGVDASNKASMMWLVSMYLMHTWGELSLSPIGLSFVVKLAPLRLASLLMGVWFLAIALSNKFAGVLSALYPEEGDPKSFLGFYDVTNLYEFFMLFFFLACGAGVLLFFLNKFLLKLMHGKG